MEVVLSDRSFSIKNLTFNLVPRLECITNSIGAQNDIYEILTSVYLLDVQVDSEQFFRRFSKINYFSYLRDVLSDVSRIGIKKVSLNVNSEFLNSSYLILLIEDFRALHIALEISETVEISPENLKAIRALANHHNVSIWLDDFGKGFSNFDTIAKFSFNAIINYKPMVI